MPGCLSHVSSRIPATPSSRVPAFTLVACVVVGQDEDLPALAQALRWRDALRARLSLLYALAAPVCVASVAGGIWCDDPIATRIASKDWLQEHTAGLGIEEIVLLPGPAGASVGDWIVRNEPLLLVAARRRGRLARLLGGDAAAHLPRSVRCAIQLVSAPSAVASGAGPPGGRAELPAASAPESSARLP